MTFEEIVEAVGFGEILIIAGHVLTSRVPEFSAPCLRCGRSPLSAEVLLREMCDGPELTKDHIRKIKK